MITILDQVKPPFTNLHVGEINSIGRNLAVVAVRDCDNGCFVIGYFHRNRSKIHIAFIQFRTRFQRHFVQKPVSTVFSAVFSEKLDAVGVDQPLDEWMAIPMFSAGKMSQRQGKFTGIKTCVVCGLCVDGIYGFLQLY